MGQNYTAYVQHISFTACKTYADQITEDPVKYGKFNGKTVTLWPDEYRHYKVTEITSYYNAVSIALLSAIVVYAIAIALLAASIPPIIGTLALGASLIPFGVGVYYYIMQWGVGKEFEGQAIREAQDFLKFGPVDTWQNPQFRDCWSHDSESFNHQGRATAITSMTQWRNGRMTVYTEAKAKPNFLHIVQCMYQGLINDPACTKFCTEMFSHDPETQRYKTAVEARFRALLNH